LGAGGDLAETQLAALGVLFGPDNIKIGHFSGFNSYRHGPSFDLNLTDHIKPFSLSPPDAYYSIF
jgi:hypothetical protein